MINMMKQFFFMWSKCLSFSFFSVCFCLNSHIHQFAVSLCVGWQTLLNVLVVNSPCWHKLQKLIQLNFVHCLQHKIQPIPPQNEQKPTTETVVVLKNCRDKEIHIQQLEYKANISINRTTQLETHWHSTDSQSIPCSQLIEDSWTVRTKQWRKMFLWPCSLDISWSSDITVN